MSAHRLLAAALLLFATMTHATDTQSLTPAEHQRGGDQTFLTFPEWYLVHSPAEYASFLTQPQSQPSGFPFFSHIAQFWQGYGSVSEQTKAYPFNGGYHLMVSVIGASTTVEYGIKGLYERTIGRLAEATKSGPEPTPEERLGARVAQAYVDFIRVDPWYLFDFKTRITELWALPWEGPNKLRRAERRFLLTSEYLVKEGYARLIKLATGSIYDAPKPVTAIVIDKIPTPDPARPEFKLLAKPSAAAGNALATIPRYEAFTAYSRWLAGQGAQFQEIAGNRGEIVVSLLAPKGYAPSIPGARKLFTQPILTRENQERVVLALPIPRLSELLRSEGSGMAIEHVYDF